MKQRGVHNAVEAARPKQARAPGHRRGVGSALEAARPKEAL